MKTSIFKIEGMHCAGCAQIIQNTLERQQGVKACTVSYERGQARVMFDPNTLPENALVQAVEKAGYAVTEQT